MPLTKFQTEVMEILAVNRCEASHVAGGLVLNAPPDSARFSDDFDFFHDAIEDLARHSEMDVAALEAAGFQVERVDRCGVWKEGDSFRKAIVRRADDKVELDWAHDAAWRFFPIEHDPVLGWRLHLFDMAVNKALALSARSETRDYIDILELGRIFPLEAIVWAACGKDVGFSPLFLLKMMLRFANLNPGSLAEIQARHLDPIEMKKTWLGMADRADAEITRIADSQPDLPIGIAFVDEIGAPRWIGERPDLRPHAISLRGCWPVARNLPTL